MNWNMSDKALKLWAKLSRDSESEEWLSLVSHLIDTAYVARFLWDNWVSDSEKRIIVDSIGGIKFKDARNLYVFLSGVHDVGKATPSFQFKAENIGTASSSLAFSRVSQALPICSGGSFINSIPHSIASEVILEDEGFDPSLGAVLGGHHGRPPSRKDVKKLRAFPGQVGRSNKEWTMVQKELLSLGFRLSGVSEDCLKKIKISVPGQLLLTGLVSMADWIASNELAFPYRDHDSCGDYIFRAEVGWNRINLPIRWNPSDSWKKMEIYQNRFGFNPRPFQIIAKNVAKDVSRPGVFVIEAPTGEGKTEAALAMAEILSQRFGTDGIFFALPTQATADGMFNRFLSWMNEACHSENGGRNSIFLAHGRSKYNKTFEDLSEGKWNVGDNESVEISKWTSGRKKGILSDFVIGTVDQVLMGALKQKYITLRHVGLASKVVIIDECHAYDEYMGHYLSRIIEWLGAYHVPVILLSATLDTGTRKALVGDYLNANSKDRKKIEDLELWRENDGYPRITYTDGDSICCKVAPASRRHTDVCIEKISESDLITSMKNLTSDGGCVGIIRNTVKHAQETYEKFASEFPDDEIILIHSAFTVSDRSSITENVMNALKSRNDTSRRFIIGTQVLEQSLDIDFDILATDVCPVDLLIQRVGRLHRHANPRPEVLKIPRCLIITAKDGVFDDGSEAVYGKYQLMNTLELIGDQISIPDDVPNLVEKAYSGEPLLNTIEYEDAKREDDMKSRDMITRAKVYRIKSPRNLRGRISGLVDDDIEFYDPNGKRAEATVRDASFSLEAILVIKSKDGSLHFLPDVQDFSGIQLTDDLPSKDGSFALAGCSVRIPNMILGSNVEKALTELEKMTTEVPKSWRESGWLSNQLFLLLDEDMKTTLCERSLRYDSKEGLMVMQ